MPKNLVFGTWPADFHPNHPRYWKSIASRAGRKRHQGLYNYTDDIVRLGAAGILPKQFSEKIKPMAGFRNILVHEYTEIDLREVYRVLQENLSDFETFGKYIEAYPKS